MKNLSHLLIVFLICISFAWAGDYEDAEQAYENKNYSVAFQKFNKVASAGNVLAQYQLGNMYYYGNGIPKDYGEAKRWYKLAAMQGHGSAQASVQMVEGMEAMCARQNFRFCGDGFGALEAYQAALRNNELEKFNNEIENVKRKQAEQEIKLTPYQPQTTQHSNNNVINKNSRRIALVIGNANYNSAPLKNPLNDAADISAALRQSGFEVIDQRNATLQEMTRGIREFGDKLLKSDVGLVYYSGHGLEVKGRNYLLPVNASMIREDEIAFQAIDANLILEKMNTAKKSVNILIVDACRDNPFARSFRSVNRGLAQMDAPTGTIVSFSTAPGKTASDGDGRNSPFTKNLVKAMMRADMPIEAMFKEVRKSVVEETKGQQTPWESSSLIGDFYFKVSK